MLELFFLVLAAVSSFSALIFCGFTWFTAKTFLERMDERDTAWAARIAALPTDVTGSRMLEAMEKLGIQLPPPLPVVTDDELLARVRAWALEGVGLGYQARKNSPTLTNIDAFRLAQGFVQERLAEARLDFPPRRLAQLIETAVVEWNTTH